MKKVLFVATVVRTHINAFHLPYLQWFKEQGWKTYVCAKNDFDPKTICCIPFCDTYYDIDFSRSPLNKKNWSAYKELIRIIDTEKIEIVHCHTPVGGALARLACMNSKIKPKVIYTAHGFHFFEGASLKNWLIYYPIERILARFTDTIITINKEDYMIAKRFKCKKVEYVRGVGIDVDKFRIDKSNLKISQDLKVYQNKQVLLSVGELINRKNHSIILKMMFLLKNDFPDLVYLICGSGENEVELKNMVKHLNIEDRVVFLGFRKDIVNVLSIAKIFIFPSIHEGLPVALMEAMAAGLPCVVSNIRGSRDLISNKGGYCVNQSVQEYASAIQKLLKDDEQCATFSNHNRQEILKYDLQSILNEMVRIYNSYTIPK